MKVLLDTNVLLRSAEPAHTQHATAREALRQLQLVGHEGIVVPQVVYEFWVVATRPIEGNGLGLTAQRAVHEVAQISSLYSMHCDDIVVYELWYALVSSHQVMGKTAHDVRLVAAMVRHGITHILSFNEQDFLRFSEVVVVNPGAVGSLPPASP